MSVQLTQTHLLVGLTGGIGSGKSTVAQLFANLGVRVIDADLLSHQLTAKNGAAIPLIAEAFGRDFIGAGGALDREKMRKKIFSDAREKKKLENILHPLILNLAKQAAFSSTNCVYTLLVIPLLFEGKNYQSWLHRTLVVDCAEEIQMRRTMQRSGLAQESVQSIMDQQMSRKERLSHADDVICNDGDLDRLKMQVLHFHAKYLAMTVGND